MMSKSPISVYIHWPFCIKKCPYCDFNSFVDNKVDYEKWSEAYVKVIKDEYYELLQQKIISSVFFGGGTPSLATPAVISAVIDELGKVSQYSKNVEITLEANPTSVEAEKFSAFAKAGVNRVSLGIQSLQEKNLLFLGRNHSVDEAKNAIAIAQKYFSNYSLDFIYALPHQTLNEWESELREIMQFDSNHLSLYQLTIENNTKFGALAKQGFLNEINEDIAVDMFEFTNRITREHGLESYEVSNYAKPGYESKHNLNYWQYGDYIGIGPGAHGRFHNMNGEKVSTVDRKQPELWLKQVSAKGNGIEKNDILNSDAIREEKIIMGLRTKYGIDYKLVANKQDIVDDLINQKFLTTYIYNNKTFVKTTMSGMHLLNSIIYTLV